MWIARDKDGTLTLYEYMPVRGDDHWYNLFNSGSDGQTFILDSSLFPEFDWENEPLEVYLEIYKAMKFRLSEPAINQIEKETGMTIEELKKLPLHDFNKI